MVEKETFALENFKNIQQLIVFIHNKANAILIVDGFLLTLFVNFAKDLVLINPLLLKNSTTTFLSIFTFILGLISAILLIYQIYYILFCIIKPKFAKHYSKKEISLFYFEHISNLSKNDFVKLSKDLTSDDIHEQIIGQVYEVSKIMLSKSKRISFLLVILFISIISLLSFILLSKLI